MRGQHLKENRLAGRYIPKGATAIEQPGGVVYTYEVNGVPYAIGYRGTAGKASFNYRFRNEENRQREIESFFAGIKSHAEYQTKRREENKTARASFKSGEQTGETKSDYSLTETAALIRETLAKAFPNTKFSVRSSSYSGGCSIDVSWIDGPIGRQVQPILDSFQGADFDGMQDLKTYRDAAEFRGKRVRFHVDYVHGQRSESAASLRAANEHVSRETGLPLLEVKEDGKYSHFTTGSSSRVPFHLFVEGEGVPKLIIASDPTGGEWHDQLLYQVARLTSHEKAAEKTKAPQVVNESYINSVVERMLSEEVDNGR